MATRWQKKEINWIWSIFNVYDKLQSFFMLELKNISFANKVKELLMFMTSFNSSYWKWNFFPLEVMQLLMSTTSSNSFCKKWKGSPLKIKQFLISMTSSNFSFHYKKSWFKKLEQLIKKLPLSNLSKVPFWTIDVGTICFD